MKLIIFPFVFTVILTLISMLFFAKLSHENMIKYKESSNIMVKNSDLYYDMKQEKIDRLNKESNAYLWSSKKYLFLYTILIVVVALVLFFMEKILFSFFISIVSIMSLSIAIFSPLMLIIAESTQKGTVLLHHEIKTFIEIIDQLLHSKEYGLTLMLVLVAILIPSIKSLIILIYNFLRVFKKKSKSYESYDIIKTIGWWSMMDVITLIILIDILILKDNIYSEIIVGNGLYFFILYLFLSMLSVYQLLNPPKSTTIQ
ncbi:MAG: paraquat-inducible protein A [Sulfurovaceae bacterium]|nr:paraquat-inducible protein A [Sulfurovaceae bacterium]